MPELPEVEVTRREIERFFVGRAIAGVETTRDSYFFLTPPRVLRRRLLGRTVERLDRSGKYLVAFLDDGSRLLLHLGMTGQLGVAAPEANRSRDAHTHLVLRFAGAGPPIHFRDARKFGKVQWLRAGENSPRLDRLGVDALSASGAELHRATRGRRAPVKTVLLDQSVLAGVGNIYADEALFLAGVRPTRPARRLTLVECTRVVDAVGKVMRRAIDAGGSTISDYVRPEGERGAYQDERHVYARAGEACAACGTRIRRLVLGQRSSCYCPKCQR